MGKPGGFFKRFKARQKRETAKRRRGTKGASKEERLRKHNERVEYYAAKRQAEDLAAVSSSSESEASTDSERELTRHERKLRKLRSLLGVGEPTGATNGGYERKNTSKRPRSSSRYDGSGEEEEEASFSESDGRTADSADEAEPDETTHRQSKKPSSALKQAAPRRNQDGREAGNGDNGEDEEEEEGGEADDWEAFLGGSDADDEEDDEEDGEEDDEEDDEEDEDDSDRLKEEDLLIKSLSDDDAAEGSDGEGRSEVNPFFELLEEGEDDDNEEEDRIDPEEFDEEEAEEEESDPEDVFVDEDGEGEDTESLNGKEPQKDAESHALLPQFKLGTTSLATLQSSGVVTAPDDPWYVKYHLDAVKTIDRTPLENVPISRSALEALRTANAARQQRAKRREIEEGAAATRKDVFFVSSEDYNAVHPENVSVAATATARSYFKKHSPFAASAVASASASASADDSNRPPYVHEALWQKWVQFRSRGDGGAAYFSNTAGVVLTAEERGFFDILQGYTDVMDCTRCWQNAESRREVFLLHLLNHWFKARAVVVLHDKILAAHKERCRLRRKKQQEEQKARKQQQQRNGGEGGSGSTKRRKVESAEAQDSNGKHNDDGNDDDDDDVDEDLELRDRSFGKTRLLVMLPMRNQAYEYVNTIVRLLGADPADCPKLATFEQDFTEVEEAMDPTFKRRPKEYQLQFAGNIDDSFCVGLRLETNRVHVYAHPLNSDIILCSPLGLRRRLEKSGDVLVSLSSIEVCVVDEAHVLLEQNWQQVTAVMELLNKRPTDTTHGLSDLRRVYAWALEGKSGRHRQTIISTDLSNATILSTFRSAINSFGKVVLQHRTEEGVLGKVQVPVRQHFIRFDPQSLESLDDDRFDFFTTNVYPTKIHPLVERDVRTIIVVPSYFDFVRLRNHMYKEYRESFTAISEYTSIKQQRRALGQFSDLERPVLLVTERFYFFKRYFVKFSEVLVFYSPPLFPSFYASLVNRLVATSPNAFAMTVFSRYDTHELNRLVGTNRMRHLLERESGVFSFVTS